MSVNASSVFAASASDVSLPIVQAIEDAILLGNIKEIDGVLDLVKEDETFPTELRYGLEALLYFRLYYGKGGALAPVNDSDRQKALRMESLWGRELIESLGYYPALSEFSCA